jgi:hypothetical protein
VHYEEVSSAHFRGLAPERKIVDCCVGIYFVKTNLTQGSMDDMENLVYWGTNQTRCNKEPLAIGVQCYLMHAFAKALWVAKPSHRRQEKAKYHFDVC